MSTPNNTNPNNTNPQSSDPQNTVPSGTVPGFTYSTLVYTLTDEQRGSIRQEATAAYHGAMAAALDAGDPDFVTGDGVDPQWEQAREHAEAVRESVIERRTAELGLQSEDFHHFNVKSYAAQRADALAAQSEAGPDAPDTRAAAPASVGEVVAASDLTGGLTPQLRAEIRAEAERARAGAIDAASHAPGFGSAPEDVSTAYSQGQRAHDAVIYGRMKELGLTSYAYAEITAEETEQEFVDRMAAADRQHDALGSAAGDRDAAAQGVAQGAVAQIDQPLDTEADAAQPESASDTPVSPPQTSALADPTRDASATVLTHEQREAIRADAERALHGVMDTADEILEPDAPDLAWDWVTQRAVAAHDAVVEQRTAELGLTPDAYHVDRAPYATTEPTVRGFFADVPGNARSEDFAKAGFPPFEGEFDTNTSAADQAAPAQRPQAPTVAAADLEAAVLGAEAAVARIDQALAADADAEVDAEADAAELGQVAELDADLDVEQVDDREDGLGLELEQP